MHINVLHHALRILVILFLVTSGQASAKDFLKYNHWELEDVLQSDTLPFAIGHRGYGDNLGEDPDRPIENTVPSVRRAFREGIQIIEVDVVITKDKRIVALHDDYLDDFTCVNTLKFGELKERLDQVSTLKQILQTARRFTKKKRNNRPSGQVIVEIKTPSPLCDPEDNTVPDLVYGVLKDINHSKMGNQVLVESFSPEILELSKVNSPDIPTMLTLSVLQLLPAEQIEAITDLPVTLIDKNAGFNLQWAEIGLLFRLPGYVDINEYLQTILQTSSQAASLDSLFLGQAELTLPGSGRAFIDYLHLLGLSALVYTIDTEPDWLFYSSLGADGIYTNDIPLGLMLEGQ